MSGSASELRFAIDTHAEDDWLEHVAGTAGGDAWGSGRESSSIVCAYARDWAAPAWRKTKVTELRSAVHDVDPNHGAALEPEHKFDVQNPDCCPFRHRFISCGSH